jgi:hypothetical protein
MEKNLLWVIIVMLVVIAFGVQGVARSVDLLRNEVEEFRQYMMGEKTDDLE